MRWKTAIFFQRCLPRTLHTWQDKDCLHFSGADQNLQMIKMVPVGTSQPLRKWSAQVRQQKMEVRRTQFRKAMAAAGETVQSVTPCCRSQGPRSVPSTHGYCSPGCTHLWPQCRGGRGRRTQISKAGQPS